MLNRHPRCSKAGGVWARFRATLLMYGRVRARGGDARRDAITLGGQRAFQPALAPVHTTCDFRHSWSCSATNGPDPLTGVFAACRRIWHARAEAPGHISYRKLGRGRRSRRQISRRRLPQTAQRRSGLAVFQDGSANGSVFCSEVLPPASSRSPMPLLTCADGR
jgi:hypothetical protein